MKISSSHKNNARNLEVRYKLDLQNKIFPDPQIEYNTK